MLAYAANARPVGRRNSPTTLALILGAHAVLLGFVIQNKMTFERPDPAGIKIIPITVPKPPPPPEPVLAEPQPNHASSTPYTPPTANPLPTLGSPIATTSVPGPTVIDPVIGTATVLTPYVPPRAIVMPVRKSAVLLTSGDDLTPPYPESRRDRGQETLLRLTLDIDARGRVIAATPSGSADSAFLDAGRRHILAHWRYRPASEDGRAIPSRVTINLLFRLED